MIAADSSFFWLFWCSTILCGNLASFNLVMAKAGLTIDAGLKSAWDAAEAGGESEPVQFLAVAVEGSSVALRGEIARGAGDVEAAFARLSAAALAPPSGPGLFLLRGGASGGRWVLVSYVPEETHPKTKMLLAAARDDVKRALGGSARFGADYHVSEAGDLTAAAYAAWQSRDRESAMSEGEKAMARVVAESEQMRLSSGAWWDGAGRKAEK